MLNVSKLFRLNIIIHLFKTERNTELQKKSCKWYDDSSRNTNFDRNESKHTDPFKKMKFQLLFVAALIATSVAEFPPKYVDDPTSDVPAGHLKAFGYHRLPDGPVAEESGFLHPKTFWEKYVSIHKPMVYRNAVSDSPAIVNWSDQYLVEMFGDLDVILEVKRENRTKSPQRVSVKLFIERYRKEDVYAVTVMPDPMRADIQVPSCLLCGTFRDFVHETNFWMSSGGTRSVIHYDADENIHCIVNGSKDFMMMENKFKQYLPMFSKKQFSGSGFSALDPDSVDLVKYPDIAKVQWTYATLYPGDCIYIPSEYLHQVRSYQRTISATMLFTSDTSKSFQDTGCNNTSFEYTPLSDIDVHWTYKKGDKTIDMGYMNIEVLRKNILYIFNLRGEEFVTVKDFAHFYFIALEDVDEDEESQQEVEELFTKVFNVAKDGKVTKEQVRNLSRENLKVLARGIDSPHGPVEGEEDDLNNFYDKDEL